jgi:hypothetical protein
MASDRESILSVGSSAFVATSISDIELSSQSDQMRSERRAADDQSTELIPVHRLGIHGNGEMNARALWSI